MEPITRLYPLFPSLDFDSAFVNAAWPIALCSSYPAELKERLLAALISLQFGLKSVDYTRKNYVHEFEDEEASREDVKIASFLKESHSFLYLLVEELTHHEDGTVGRILAEFALLRQEFSFLQLLAIANRGALFEGLVVARMQIEQLAWICAVDREPDPEKARRIQAQSSLSKLKRIEPRVGKLYGYLSDHAHWSYGAHVRALLSKDERLGVLFASVYHKIELYMVMLSICEVQMKVIFNIRASEIGALAQAEQYEQRRKTIAREIEAFHKMLKSRLVNVKQEVSQDI
ncbi:hypothetical protein P0086_12470 [Mycoplana sp. MJR14]|nr:hypothetical protein [Mycoplana sp. MJR14]